MEPKETGVNEKINTSNHKEIDISKIPLKNQVLLNGISAAQNEDLQSIFMSIAKEIEYDTTDPLSIPQLRRQLTIKSTIIMYFSDHDFKTKFYNQFFEKCPLKKEFLNAMKTPAIMIRGNFIQRKIQ